jgi:hypothetical protein
MTSICYYSVQLFVWTAVNSSTYFEYFDAVCFMCCNGGMGMGTGMGTISNGDGRGWGCTLAGMDGDGDEVLRGRLGMELGLAGTVGDGDRCSSPCSSLS